MTSVYEKQRHGNHTVMFVAPNFDAQEFVQAYYYLRNMGGLVTTVGVRAGAIADRSGLQIAPDQTVSGYVRRQQTPIDQIVILGKSDCVRLILTDPRIIQMIEAAQLAGKPIYCSRAAQRLLNELGIRGGALFSTAQAAI